MTASVWVFHKQTKLATLAYCCQLRISTYLQCPALFVTYGANKYKTLMHSSRMRTARSLAVSRSIQWSGMHTGVCVHAWGVMCAQGVHAWGG